MTKLIFASTNENKATEVTDILKASGIDICWKKLDIVEIQDPDISKVAKFKGMEAYKILKAPVLVEDTGLHIKSMNDYPGSLTKHFYRSIGLEGILDFLKGKPRGALAVTTFAFCDNDGVKTFTGEVEGTISEHIAKKTWFDWDVIFIPKGYDRTYAELPRGEKNSISQRRKAIDKFLLWYTTKKV